MVLSQLNVVTAFAEIMQANGDQLILTVAKQTASVGEEVEVQVKGTSAALKKVTIDRDETALSLVKEQVVNENQKNITLKALKEGSFSLKAISGNLISAAATLAVTPVKETTNTSDTQEPAVGAPTPATPDNTAQLKDASQEYNISMTAPAQVTFGNDYSYDVIINSSANSAQPITGTELTFTPPAGYSVDSIPIGADQVVKSYTVNPDGTVTIILNELTDSIVDFKIAMTHINDNDRFNNESIKAEITGNATPSGQIPTSDATTTIVGNTNYQATKSVETIIGSGNRLVKYSFDINREGNDLQFSLHEQTLTDQIPAGAIITSSTPADGKWTITGDQANGWTAVWTRTNLLVGNSNSLTTQSGSTPSLLISYPEDKFPNKTLPPVNTVNLSGKDKNGQDWAGKPGSVQGPMLEDGSVTKVGIEKKMNTQEWLSGSVYTSYYVMGSFLKGAGTQDDAASLVLEDAKDEFSNAGFWGHFTPYMLSLNFNESIVQSNAHYVLEYQTTATGWQKADEGVATATDKRVGFTPENSINYGSIDRLTKEVSLKNGEVLTGWRLKVYDPNGKDIGAFSQVKVTALGIPSYKNIYTQAIEKTDNLKNTAKVNVTKADGTKLAEETGSDTVNVKKNLNLNTVIEAPKSLEVNKTGNYTVYASNLTPEEDVTGTVMRVVLPAGVTYDRSVGVTANAASAPYQLKTPVPGKDVLITTETLPASANYPFSREVVVFKFMVPLQSMRTPEAASDRGAEGGGFPYTVPVKVSSVAYDAYVQTGNIAPVESWITTDDSNYQDYAVTAYTPKNKPDIHDFDAIRDSISYAEGQSQIITQGGLLLTKSVEGTAGSGFSDHAEVFAEDTATWKLTLRNLLPVEAKAPVIFDDLATINPNATFATELAGPITVPSGAVVEYSTDATSATTGTWTNNWQNAKAFRVTLPDLVANSTPLEITVPVSIPKTVQKDDVSINTAQGTATVNGAELPYTSNEAKVTVLPSVGSVELTKTDKETGTALQGALFELQDLKGNVLQQNLQTDASGKLVINDLAVGEYQFVETQAPFGYQLDKTPIKFTIVKNQQASEKVTKTNELLPGSVVLTKLDSTTNKQLSGAVFQLQDANGKLLSNGLITDAKGQIIVNDLKPGDYQLVETQAPTGYELDQTPVTFTIVKGQTQAVQVTKMNKSKPGSVILTKEDKDTGIALAGGIFELQTATGKTLQSGLTTGKDGKLVVDKLAAGDYQFVETQAPVGYQLDATPVSFSVISGETKAVQVIKTNTLKVGSVILTKTDEKTGKVLQGAIFDLQDQQGKTIKKGLTTGEDGKFALDKLPVGTYQLVEVQAPTGYELDNTPVKFTIVDNQTSAVQLTKTNKMTPGAVILEKIDDITGEALAGAEFQLEDQSGKVLLSHLVTDKSGRLAIDALEPGKYQLVETKAPAGYELDAMPVVFEVKAGKNATTEVEKVNHAKAQSVVLTKIDETRRSALAGAIFQLQDSTGKVLKKELSTDKNGKLVIENLATGTYQLVETKAPTGYELDTTPIKFEISKDTLNLSLTKTNYTQNAPETDNSTHGNSGSTYFPNTGTVNKGSFYILGVLLVSLSGWLYFGRKTKRNN